MARPLRIEYPGAFYHVINRGLERRDIYRCDKDREYFLSLLGKAYKKYGLVVHGYCLMSNHYHLYLETPNGKLHKIMQQIDGNYTQKFNQRHGRVGPLLQGRYKAMLIEQDNYSLQLLKYIHLNPLKAKMVEKTENYKWSSYLTYLGKVPAPIFLNTDWILSQLDNSLPLSRKALKIFTEEEDVEQGWSPETEAFKGIILGRSDFVSHIQKTFLTGKVNPEIPELELLSIKPYNKEEAVETAVKSLKLEPGLEKKFLIYALRNYTFLSLKEIVERIAPGKHYSFVTQIVSRLQKQGEVNTQIKNLLDKLNQIF